MKRKYYTVIQNQSCHTLRTNEKNNAKKMPQWFKNNIQIELWAHMGLNFKVLKGSAGGSIFNEFLIGQKLATIWNIESEVRTNWFWVRGGGGTPWVPPGYPPPHTQQEPEPLFESYSFRCKDSKTQILRRRFTDSENDSKIPHTPARRIPQWCKSSLELPVVHIPC